MTNLSLNTEEHALLRLALGKYIDHLRTLLGEARESGRTVAEARFLDQLLVAQLLMHDKLEAA